MLQATRVWISELLLCLLSAPDSGMTSVMAPVDAYSITQTRSNL